MGNISSKVLFSGFIGISFNGEEFMQVLINLDRNYKITVVNSAVFLLHRYELS